MVLSDDTCCKEPPHNFEIGNRGAFSCLNDLFLVLSLITLIDASLHLRICCLDAMSEGSLESFVNFSRKMIDSTVVTRGVLSVLGLFVHAFMNISVGARKTDR